jgi:hypothetical protein
MRERFVRINSFSRKKNVTLPLALCLSGFARWHYGGISGIFGRFLIIFMRKNQLKGKIFVLDFCQMADE